MINQSLTERRASPNASQEQHPLPREQRLQFLRNIGSRHRRPCTRPSVAATLVRHAVRRVVAMRQAERARGTGLVQQPESQNLLGSLSLGN